VWLCLGLPLPLLLASCGLGWQLSSLLGLLIPLAAILSIRNVHVPVSWVSSAGSFILTLYKEARDRFCPCFSETLKNIKIIEKT
jgi:hypothetical protein